MFAAGLGFLTLLVGGLLILHLDPIFVLVLCVGAAVLVSLIFTPILGVHVFIALLYFENALVNSEGVTAMEALGPFIIAAWLMNLMLRRRPLFRVDPFIITLFLFLTWCGVTLLLSQHLDASWLRMTTYLELSVMTMMFISVVDDEPRLISVLWSMVIWTAVASVAGLFAYAVGLMPMVTGPGENRNGFAMFLVIGIIAAFTLGERTARPSARLALRVGFLPLFLVALALALSRAGYICLIVAVAFLWYRSARSRRMWPAVAMVLVVALTMPFLPEVFWSRVSSILPSIARQEDTFGRRVDVWQVGWTMIKDHPLFGVGVGSFMAAQPSYVQGEKKKPIASHNSYVGIAAETGVIGLLLFLLLHVRSLQSAQRAFRAGRRLGRPDLQGLATATEGSIVTLMVGALSGNTETLKILWVFFAMSSTLGVLAYRLEVSAPPEGPSEP
jgi:O-antigen ligase